MASERTEQITAADGQSFDAWVWVPDSGAGPGILLLQEIFGVGEFLRSKAADLAALGYVVLCPDVFWRTERRVAHDHDEAGLQAAFASMTRWAEQVDQVTNAEDLLAALAALRALPETSGRKVAAMGYCLGGRLAYDVAIAGDPDAAVCYYGSGIGGQLDLADEIGCPILFHYGGSDPFIPDEEANAVRARFESRPDAEVHVHGTAGHAFENFLAEQFHDPAASEVSWQITTAFLARVLEP